MFVERQRATDKPKQNRCEDRESEDLRLMEKQLDCCEHEVTNLPARPAIPLVVTTQNWTFESPFEGKLPSENNSLYSSKWKPVSDFRQDSKMSAS
jgi:hypothetical protein